MDDGVEILLSFPLVVEQAIGSVVRGQLSQAFPAIGLPFDGAIGAVEFANAIARVLGPAVGFKLGEVGSHCLERNSLAVGFDAHHTLAIKRAPGTLPFVASNGEITAADDVGLC